MSSWPLSRVEDGIPRTFPEASQRSNVANAAKIANTNELCFQNEASSFVRRLCGSEAYLPKLSRPPFNFDTMKSMALMLKQNRHKTHTKIICYDVAFLLKQECTCYDC